MSELERFLFWETINRVLPCFDRNAVYVFDVSTADQPSVAENTTSTLATVVYIILRVFEFSTDSKNAFWNGSPQIYPLPLSSSCTNEPIRLCQRASSSHCPILVAMGSIKTEKKDK